MELFAPRAGQRLCDIDALSLDASGSATIISAVVASLGARVLLISAVGDDELGVEWKRRVEQAGIDVNAVVAVPGQLTPIAVSTVDLSGEKTYAFYRFRGICDPLNELRLSKALEEEVARADVFIVTEAMIRGPGSREAVAVLLERRRQLEGGLTMLSVNYRPSAWTDAADAVAVLSSFANLASAVCCNQQEYRMLAPALAKSKLVYETLGSNGVNIHAEGKSHHVPARSVPTGVVLDTGAGDVFCAAVAVALGEGQAPHNAGEFAAAVSALAISREGTMSAAPPRDEVEALLASAPQSRKETV